MSSNESHDQIINKVYYDPTGYGSITSTFKEAFQNYKTITLNDVNNGLNLILKLLNKSKVATHS